MKSKLFDQEQLDQVAKLLNPTFAAVEPARGQSVVPVLGATGDGKSTLMNYLSGCTYNAAENDLGNLTAQLSQQSTKEVCRVGRNPQVSETRYPQVITPHSDNNPSSFLYCDLPGFFDSGNEAEEICSAEAPQIVNRSAASIKGIIWVLSLNQFEVNKSEGIKKILSYLLKIAGKNTDLIAESLVIVITKANKNTKIENVLNRFLSVIDTIEDSEQKSLLNKILNRIKLDNTNFIIADVFDHTGSSRNTINAAVSSLKARNTNDFDFSSYSPVQITFYSHLIDAAQLYIDSNEKLDGHIKKQSAIASKIAYKNQRINQLDTESKALLCEQEDRIKQLKDLQEQIGQHQKTIGAMEQHTFLKEVRFNQAAEMIPGTHSLMCGPMDYNSPTAMTNRGNAIALCYAAGYTHTEYNSCIYAVVPPKPKPGEATYHLAFEAEYPVSVNKLSCNKDEQLIDGTEKTEHGYAADIKYQIGQGVDVIITFEIETKNTSEGREKLSVEKLLKDRLVQKSQKLEQRKEELTKKIIMTANEREQVKSELGELEQLNSEMSATIQDTQDILSTRRGFFQSVHNMILTLEINAEWVSKFTEFFNRPQSQQDLVLSRISSSGYGLFSSENAATSSQPSSLLSLTS